MPYTCEKCGFYTPANINLTKPVFCGCGYTWVPEELRPEMPYPPTIGKEEEPCLHRGDYIGQAECKCGRVYRCTKYGLLCSDRPPVDEFVYAGDVQLNAENYRCCRGCEGRE